ncbi:MAG: hypothetical protein MUC60_15285 [Oscillatoria sp. Prado101]|nr:hypothetical protein [Oscillatoria sp. Prado101]
MCQLLVAPAPVLVCRWQPPAECASLDKVSPAKVSPAIVRLSKTAGGSTLLAL